MSITSDIFADLSFPDAPNVRNGPPGPKTRELLERQGERESNARTYPRGIPIAPAAARGATLRDVDGNTFIDCLAGAGTLNVGHNNPYVVEAVRKALESEHIMTSLDLPTGPKDAFTSLLLSLLPEPLRSEGRIQFCGPTGSDAVDAALKLTKTATGRNAVIAFSGAYHGMGQGPLSLMGATAPKQALGALVPDSHFMPYAYCHRCPLHLTPDTCDTACAHLLGNTLGDSHGGVPLPAAIIVEALQGEGGSIVPPSGWLTQIAAYARAHDVPLICDEIQSGMGRTGKWFAFEHEGVVPDVVVLSKAIGGIGLPLAVVVYHKDLDRWQPGAHAGTFRGNQLAMVAGTAAIEFTQRYGLVEHAARLGERLLANLRHALGGSQLFSDMRGRGLMIGLETTSGAAAKALRREALSRGLIFELGGRDDRVVRLLPPLVLTDDLADRIVDILVQSERAVQDGPEGIVMPGLVGVAA